MNLDEKIELIKKYNEEIFENKPCEYGYTPNEILKTCEKLKALKLDWGSKVNFSDFRITKGFNILNSYTNYIPNKDEYYIQWDNGNIGAYQFVDSEDDYYEVQDEYKEFKNKLMSYNPIDWDNRNNHIIYDIENGKKVINDYKNILKDTKEKMNKKIKKSNLERAKQEYEKLVQGSEEDNENI